MKKILFVHHTSGWGGPTNSLIQLISDLDKTKYIPEVLFIKNSELVDRFIRSGIKSKVAESYFFKHFYQFFPHSEAGYLKWYQLFSFIKLSLFWCLSRFIFAKRELKNHEFDIVHLNSSVLTDWLAPSMKMSKVIIHIREPFRKGKFDLLHYFFRWNISKYADKVIAISYDNLKRLNITSKAQVIYNYSNYEQVLPDIKSYSSKKVLYLGGSSTSKGFFTMVKALDHLNKDVLVYFGGQYSTWHNIRNPIDILKNIFSNARKRRSAMVKINSHRNAIVIGLINNTQEYFDQVCCLVSPFEHPHFSRPVIEGYLNKKPAIGTDVEGMDELIEHEVTGLLVKRGDAEGLAKAINYLTSNDKKAILFGENGYSVAIQKYSRLNINQFQDCYDEL